MRALWEPPQTSPIEASTFSGASSLA